MKEFWKASAVSTVNKEMNPMDILLYTVIYFLFLSMVHPQQ